jgi:hypothetical protein
MKIYRIKQFVNGNKKSHSKVKLAVDQYAGLVQLLSSISSTVQSLYYGKDPMLIGEKMWQVCVAEIDQ